MPNMGIQRAFEALCKDAERGKACVVSLYANVSWYGGPEEGGWWGNDTVLDSYQRCSTQEQADQLKEKVEELAKLRTKEARRAWGEQCASELEWCDERMLDYDYLRETDGHNTFFVTVEQYPGKQEQQGDRQWS